MDENKITNLLRTKELTLKKVQKESTRIVAYDTVTGSAKDPEELAKTSATFQSVIDHLRNICQTTAIIRKANVGTMTDMANYFGEQMSIADCRQGIVSGKIIGNPSVHYHLKALYNKILRQMQDTNISVKSHNDQHTSKLKAVLDTEYQKHENERKSCKDQEVQLPVDFESSYVAKLESITEAYWTKNKAQHVDPLSIFSVLKSLSDWNDEFEKNRELKINRANNSIPITTLDLTPFNPSENEHSVSLEELNNLISDKNEEITTAIGRLVVVTWKIGQKDPIAPAISSAQENFNLVMDMIRSYGLMQNTFRIVSTFTETNFVNPLTGEKMSAVDMADYKNTVIPVISKMLDIVEKQKATANSQVKSQEGTTRTEVIKMLETSMNSASARPTAEKMKEYTSNLLESVSTRMVVSPNIDEVVGRYKTLLDEFNSKLRPALATINANTRVKVVWNVNSLPKPVGSWDNVNQIPVYQQMEIVQTVTDMYDDLDSSNVVSSQWNSNINTSTRYGSGGRGKSRGKY